MKLSISNIAWEEQQDTEIYARMKEKGFCGLEIAPTRIFPEQPYEKRKEAYLWSRNLKKEYGFSVCSMQSIWFGRQEKVFGSEQERQLLIAYTKKAIDFAAAVECGNLVFGCPRNRNLPDGGKPEFAVGFFRELGDYAASKGTVIGMEANPPIYHTNYINDTLSALELVEDVDSEGFRLNLDVGTMIQNGEDISELNGKVGLINHVHISEPGLRPIEKRELHMELRDILLRENYRGFVSVEMGRTENITLIDGILEYIRGVFA